ncbi:MAG: lactate utilization protein C, partial [Burkholderiales bacterium]
MTAPSSPDSVDLLDTTSARSQILGRIRAARGRQGEATPGERADAQAWIARQAEGPRPTVSQDVVAHFEAQAARMSSTTERVQGMAAVPEAVARYLQSHELPLQAVCWNTLGDLDWAGA